MQPSFENALAQFEVVLADKEQEFDKILFMNEVKKLRETLLIKKNQQQLLPNINP